MVDAAAAAHRHRPVAGVEDIVAGAASDIDRLHGIGVEVEIAGGRAEGEGRRAAARQHHAGRLGRGVDDQGIDPVATIQDVGRGARLGRSGPAIQRVVAIAAIEPVGLRAAGQRVVAGAERQRDPLDAGDAADPAAGNPRAGAEGEGDVPEQAAEIGDPVVDAGAAIDGAAAFVGGDDIIAGPAGEAHPLHRIGIDMEIAGIGAQRDARREAGGKLHRERLGGGVDDQRVDAIAAIDHIDRRTRRRRAGPRIDEVVPGKPQDLIALGGAVQHIRAGGSGDDRHDAPPR